MKKLLLALTCTLTATACSMTPVKWEQAEAWCQHFGGVKSAPTHLDMVICNDGTKVGR